MSRTSSPAAASLRAWLEGHRDRVDRELRAALPDRQEIGGRVLDAMAYALLSPGKRIRAALLLGVGEMYRVAGGRFIPAACAVEMVHAASLVLDDLPCMDDASTRRGRPACHVAYGEAIAILAAVGLLNQAYAILAGEGATDITRDRLRTLVARRLARAIGPGGVIGGQTADLDAADRRSGAPEVDLTTLEFIHSHKTGSLFIACAELGGHLAGATPAEVDALRAYAKNLGLAFQITDDLIDAVGEEGAAGKPVRSDVGVPTFVLLCGVAGARALAADLVQTAVGSLAMFGRRAARLEQLARYVATRES